MNFLPYFYMSNVTSNIQKHFSILTVFKNKHHATEATRKKRLVNFGDITQEIISCIIYFNLYIL